MKKRNHKRKSIVSRVAKRLYDRWGKRLVSGKRGEKIRERLVRIYPGEPVAERVEMYYVEMFALLLKIAGIGITLAVVISVPLWVEGTRELDTVGRNDGGEGDRHVDLLLRRENGQVAEKRIEVAERLYTEEELQQMFTDMLPALEKQMLGQNKSPFCVTVSLKLPDAVEGYPFEMKWHSSRPDVLNRNGSIQEPLTMEEIPVEIKGDFSFQGFEQEKVWKVIVRQAHRTEEDAWEDALETALQESDFDSAYQEEMQLPDRVAGETVVWQEKESIRGGRAAGDFFRYGSFRVGRRK